MDSIVVALVHHLLKVRVDSKFAGHSSPIAMSYLQNGDALLAQEVVLPRRLGQGVFFKVSLVNPGVETFRTRYGLALLV